MMRTAKTLSWLVALVGIWVIISPFALGTTNTMKVLWNEVAVGGALLILGASAGLSTSRGIITSINWLNAALGIWLIISPYVLAYSSVSTTTFNDIYSGAVALVLAGWAALSIGGRRMEQMPS
jgi:hypothetical protein